MDQQFTPMDCFEAELNANMCLANVTFERFLRVPVQVWWSLHAAGPTESLGLRYGQQRQCGHRATPGWAAGCQTETSLTLPGNAYKEAKVQQERKKSMNFDIHNNYMVHNNVTNCWEGHWKGIFTQQPFSHTWSKHEAQNITSGCSLISCSLTFPCWLRPLYILSHDTALRIA